VVDLRGNSDGGGGELLTWQAQRWYDRGPAELVPAAQPLPSWVVDRPAEVREVVEALGRGARWGSPPRCRGGRVREDHDREDGPL